MADIGGGVSPQQVQDMVAAAIAPVASSIPAPASSDPAPIAVSPVVGGQTPYARADHVHPSKTRRARLQTAVNGTLTWTYPTPFDAGVVPQIMAIAETAVGVTDVINVQVEGTPTNTQAVIRVTRTNQTVVALLGLTILSVPTNVGATWVNLSAFG